MLNPEDLFGAVDFLLSDVSRYFKARILRLMMDLVSKYVLQTHTALKPTNHFKLATPYF